MAQLTKVILSLKHKMLVPTAVPEDFHPLTPMHQWPFQLQREVSPWRQLTVDGALVPRRAGITSVGAGGVNAHLIVEEYITQAEPVYRSTDPTTPIVFVLSAKDKERLSEYVKQWVVYLKKKENVDLEHIAYTLQIGREEMPCRLAIVAHTQEELVQRLEQWILEQRNANHCYFSAKPYSTGNNATQIEETGDIHSELAKLWVAGNSVSWKDLYKGKHVDRIAGLPTYPFKRRTCWIDRHQDVGEAVGTVPCASPPPLASPALFPSPMFPRRTEALTFAPMVTFTSRQDHENKVVEFYTLEVERSKEGFQTEYLTFCPFEEKVPGFSMSRVFLYPEKYPDEQRLMQEKQTEMRQVLVCREDFQQEHTLLDIGCGHGTDIIQIAAQYPHITAHGLTITPAQAEFGKQRITELNLSSQAQIFQADSSKDAFPARYDLIIGIEVTFHIQDKAGLFQNIASSLNENGKVLLMDYVGNLRGAIVDPKIGVSIPTQQEWLDLLTEHQLVIDEIIDVSPQIANFLDDPAVKDNVKDLPQVTQDMYISYANQAVSLANGWISYCLLKLKKDTLRSALERWNDNAQKIAQRMPYPQALAEMVRRGHIPYPQSLRDLQKCNHNETFRDLKAIKDDLAEIFLTVLKLEPPELEAAETFQDLGISSISVVRLTEAINSKYNLRMPTSILFECKNMDELVDYINSEMGSVQGTIPTVTTQNGDQPDAIAIIGLSLRCAQAETQDEFWELVSQGKSGIEDITQKDWLDFFQFHSQTASPYRYARMRNAEYFDPSFFHISPREAKAMDVSQRILLEECYKALEDANYTPSVLSGKQVATVIGSAAIHPGETDFSHFSMLGSHMSILASRIAYFLNLKGPALAIDTAC